MKSASSTDRAALYRSAAKRIEDGLDYACCYALRAAGASYDDVDRMEKIFFYRDYDHTRYGGHWMAEHGEERYGHSEEIQNRRILALCFMAAITERP